MASSDRLRSSRLRRCSRSLPAAVEADAESADTVLSEVCVFPYYLDLVMDEVMKKLPLRTRSVCRISQVRTSTSSEIWKIIWHPKLTKQPPPKVSQFLWRACRHSNDRR